MRICIATGGYHRPQETQINFHILNLFGGNTVVMAQEKAEDDPYGRQLCTWSRRNNIAIPRQIAHKVRNFITYRNMKVPQGSARASIQSFLRAENVDAVLAEFGTTAVRIAPATVEIGLPTFAYFRGADASAHLKEPFRAEAYRRLMPHLHGVFSVSQFLLDNLARHGITHSESHVIPSGVDTALFQPSEKQPGSFLAVGRFIEKKRPDITVRSFAKVARERPEARLEMIGDGPLLDGCRALAASQGVLDQVLFHGRRPHDFVRDRLKCCEVFLQHSVVAPNGDTEGLPTSIQEAMAAGMLVVSTRHADIPEAVIDGETGFLVEEGDEAGFAECIRHALHLGDGLKSMAARARERAERRFDNRVLIKHLEQHIFALSRIHR